MTRARIDWPMFQLAIIYRHAHTAPMENTERLKAWRESRSLTQKEAALLVGVSQPNFSEWEAGIIKPGLRFALALEKMTKGAVPAAGWVEAPHAA